MLVRLICYIISLKIQNIDLYLQTRVAEKLEEYKYIADKAGRLGW